MASKIKQFCIDHLVSILLVAIAITLALSAVGAWAKYTETLSSTTSIKLSIVDYTIDKNKMWKVMQGLSTKPTTVKFVTGNNSEIQGLKNIATTAKVSALSTNGIQENDSSMIGVYQSTDGTTLYIAPMNNDADGTPVNNSFVMHTPVDASDFLRGGVSKSDQSISETDYTGLGNYLTEIDFGNLDTSRTTDMSRALSRFNKLTTLTNFTGLDTSKVKYFTDLFYWNKALTTIDVSGLETQSATHFNCMFQGCYALQSITGLTNFVTTNATTFNYMFENCYKISELDFSSFNTSNNPSMTSMFNNCRCLEKVTLSKDFTWKNGTSTDGPLPAPSSSYITGATGSWYDTTSGDAYTPSALAGVTRTETRTYTAVPTYTIDKSKMWTQLQALAKSSTVPTAIKFVKGNDSAVSGLTNLCEAGIQDTSLQSAKIAVYQDGTTVYIAPADKNDSTSVMYAPKESWGLLAGGSDKTGLGDSLITIDCTNLDTSKAESMNIMFYEQHKATTINVSSFNTSNVKNMNGMFSGCYAVGELNLSNFDTSSVTNGMQNMFLNCKALTTLTYDFNASKVTSMYQMFAGCKSLTTVDLTKLKTSNALTSTKKMFEGCDKLESLAFPDTFNTSGVTDMSYMFSACPLFSSVDVSRFDTSNVTDMSYMFAANTSTGDYQNKLKKLDLSNFDTSNVSTFRAMFYGCKDLTSLNVSSFNTAKATNMRSMFDRCSSLTSINIIGFNTENVTNFGYMFRECKGLTTLDVTSFNTQEATDFAYMFSGCNNLTTLDVTKFNTKKVNYFYCMFNECNNLTTLDVSNFDGSAATSAYMMFYNCADLSTINLSNFKTTESLTYVSSMFAGCNSLTSLTFSEDFNTSKVANMNYIFSNCGQLTSVDVSMFDTSSATFMSGMFNGCHNLTSLDLSSFNTSNVTKMTSMFKDTQKLASITLGANFDFVGTDGYLEAPSSTYITGADGNWYDTTDGTGRAPADLATFHNDLNKTRTYVAVYKEYTISKTNLGTAIRELVSYGATVLKFVKGSEVPTTGVTKSATNVGDTSAGSGTIGAWYESSSKTIYIAPDNSSDSTSLIFSPVDSHWFLREDNYGWGITEGTFTEFDLSNMCTSKTTNMLAFFYDLPALTKITFGDHFDTSNATDMSYMFRGLSKITSLDLSFFDTSKVTNMNYMFRECTALETIDISSFDTSNVTSMQGMFGSSSTSTPTQLKTIIASSKFVTSSVTTDTTMFYGCPNLKGGNGTTFNTSYTNKTYARIDTASTPGYFTAKTSTANAASVNDASVASVEADDADANSTALAQKAAASSNASAVNSATSANKTTASSAVSVSTDSDANDTSDSTTSASASSESDTSSNTTSNARASSSTTSDNDAADSTSNEPDNSSTNSANTLDTAAITRDSFASSNDADNSDDPDGE